MNSERSGGAYVTMDRFRGSLIGLAVGDAFGAQLEHVDDPFVTPLVVEPSFHHGSGTEQVLAVARGLLLAFETGRGSDSVRDGVESEMFVWYAAGLRGADPPEPTTFAMIGRAVNGERGATFGDVVHQPAVLALRVVPIGLAFRPSEVFAPTLAVTRLTHHAAAAWEAAAFSAWLTSRLVRGATLGPALVLEGLHTLAAVEGHRFLTGPIERALEVYARMVERPPAWLEAEQITADGGRDVGGAIALALVAALLGTGPDVEAAIAVGARLRGNSPVVGALTGAWLGAARGARALPRPLVEGLASVDVLVGLAEALHDGSELSGEPVEPPGPVARALARRGHSLELEVSLGMDDPEDAAPAGSGPRLVGVP